MGESEALHNPSSLIEEVTAPIENKIFSLGSLPTDFYRTLDQVGIGSTTDLQKYASVLTSRLSKHGRVAPPYSHFHRYSVPKLCLNSR